MAFVLTSLTDFVKDNADKILTGLVVDSPTADLIAREGTLQTGIKTAERIGTLTTDAVLQDGDGCGFNASGSTAISQRLLEVATIKVNEAFCLNDLEKKFTQLMMSQGSMNESMPAPIESAYVEQKMSKIAEKMEKLIWQGDTTLGGSDLNWIDGFIKIIDGAAGVNDANAETGTGTITGTTAAATIVGVGTDFVNQAVVGDKVYAAGVLLGTILTITDATHITLAANLAANVTAGSYTLVSAGVTPVTSVTGVTSANILAIVDSIYMAVPQRVLDSTDPAYLFMGTDWARMYLMALKNANLFHYAPESDWLENGFFIPGFPIKIKPTPGLTGTNRAYVIQPKNMWLGTDMENEWEEFKFWFSDDDDLLKFKARWRIGVQIGFPDEVTSFHLA